MALTVSSWCSAGSPAPVISDGLSLPVTGLSPTGPKVLMDGVLGSDARHIGSGGRGTNAPTWSRLQIRVAHSSPRRTIGPRTADCANHHDVERKRLRRDGRRHPAGP